MSFETGGSDPFAVVPHWTLWIVCSTVVLSLTFIIGLPLNGATVLIFWRRKKLRHLVNFVLLLDCVSHIILCLVCIPIQLASVWSRSFLTSAGLAGLVDLQQVVGNFANLYSTFLTVSIAILRYRRLCWKKKDKFSTMNAIKWSVTSGVLAVGVTFTQAYSIILDEAEGHQPTIVYYYLVKIGLIVLSMGIVFFCYIRVSQRVWANAANHEKVMDPMKLKKSRSVHLRATIHSCVQIVLVVATMTPHLYDLTEKAFDSRSSMREVDINFEETSSGIIGDKDSAPASASASVSSASSSVPTSDNHFARLFGITLNYTLLILGTPMAYIASCHRFREQFTSIIFGHGGNPYSPQHSTSPHQHHHQNQQSNQSQVNSSRRPSNPVSRVARTMSTTATNPSATSGANTVAVTTPNCKAAICRSVGSSVHSKRGSSRRKRSFSYACGDLGDSESTTAILNGNNEGDMGNYNYRFSHSPSPCEPNSRFDSFSSQCRVKRSSLCAVTDCNSTSIHTILQNYSYGYSQSPSSNGVGQIV